MRKSEELRHLSTDADQAVLKARSDMGIYGIPKRDYQSWRAQYHRAKSRGIPFNFTLLGWRQWWSIELARLEPGARRGRGKDDYVMARKRDRGPYEPGNVFATKPIGNVFATKPIGNMRDRDPLACEAAVRLATLTREANGHPRGEHLKVRGDGHPKAKAVMTDAGRFGSIALAAEAYGITRAGGHYRVRSGTWRFVS
jgi:hypothetical protein